MRLDAAPPEAEHAFVEGEHGLYVATDLGVDVIAPARLGRRRSHGALGVEPVSVETAECVRIESGRPRLGVDIDDTTIPQEAGLNERAVSFDEGLLRRPGDRGAAALSSGKPNRHLRGLQAEQPREQRRRGRGSSRRRSGAVGSSCVSPAHGPIALVLLAARRAGRHGVGRTAANEAEVVGLPSPPILPGRIAAGPREPWSRKERAAPDAACYARPRGYDRVASRAGGVARLRAPGSSRSVRRESTASSHNGRTAGDFELHGVG